MNQRTEKFAVRKYLRRKYTPVNFKTNVLDLTCRGY